MGFNEKLIEEVRKHECLYTSTSQDSRNVAKKNLLWHTISQKLSADEIFCRKRWRMLRDSYVRRKRRELIEHIPTQWKYMEMLSFLEGAQGYKLRVSDLENLVRKRESGEYNEVDDKLEKMETPFDESEACTYSIDEYLRFPGNESEPEVCSPESVNLNSGDHIAMPSTKYDKADIKAKFVQMINKCHERIEELSSVGVPKTSNPTLLLFQSLGYKVLAADLPQQDVDQIEYKVMSLVHEEIAKRRQRK